MRKGLLLTALCLLFAAPHSWAGAHGDMDPCTCVDYHIWGRFDLLYWRVSDAPIPPLVTTGNTIGDGILGQPGTVILLGDRVDYGTIPGVRFVGGLWFDSSATIGFEVSAFILGATSRHDAFIGDEAGYPVITVPFLSTTGAESGVFISNPNTNASGEVFVTNSLRFGGGSADLLLACCRTECEETQFFIGFKSLYLGERLNLDTVTTPFFVPSQAIFRSDVFETRNFFYGGEIGLRDIWHPTNTPFFVELQGKVAAGNNFQVVQITGQTTTVPRTGVTTTVPGGIFAQENNIGRFTRNAFAVAPEAAVRVGLELSSNLKVSVGYDIIYMTNVVRPGNQIDRTIGPVLGATTRPIFDENTFRSSTFTAQGVSLGLELRF